VSGSHAPLRFPEFQGWALDAPTALNRLSRNALVKTDTDERLMAAAQVIPPILNVSVCI
jgi:hypothetical protein